jgi:hypothetical protein
MTVARSQLVDVNATAWYHVISKTVRGAFLPGDDRKMELETRLEELTTLFAIDIAGYGVLETHLHLLVRLSPERAATWSDEEVVRCWGRLVPPRGKDRKPFHQRDLGPAKAGRPGVCPAGPPATGGSHAGSRSASRSRWRA